MERDIFEAMLQELCAFKPETIKVPAREGGYVRLPVITNCPWYREFCANYTRFRRGRDRTFIKRCHTIAALKRMMRGDRTTVYARRLLEIAGTYEIDHPLPSLESDLCQTVPF